MLRAQRAVPRVPPRVLTLASRAMAGRAFTHWAFGHYLRIAPPDFVQERPGGPERVRQTALAA
jgi:hypothetical protein